MSTNRWSLPVVAAVILVLPLGVADDSHGHGAPACDPDAVYAGVEFGFDEPFRFPGDAEDGVVVDDTDETRAFFDYLRSVPRGHSDKETHIYAVYGVLGALCWT